MEAKSLFCVPLTFRGIAAFAQASSFRLLLTEGVFGLICAASVLSLFYMGWEPPLRKAIASLPDSGAIRQGSLEWTGPTPVRLAEGALLSVVVDLADSGELGQVGDIQLEIGKANARVRSLLGYLSVPYPDGLTVALNRVHLEPWWGAWHSVVAAALGAFTVLVLLMAWAVLAVIYSPLIRVIAFFADRKITSTGAWRVASACLMPGALVMNAAIAAYALHQISLVQLLSVAVAHLAFGWIFVLAAPLRLERHGFSPAKSKNPFAGRPIEP